MSFKLSFLRSSCHSSEVKKPDQYPLHCCGCGVGRQLQLSDQTPSLGTSICLGCGPKKTKKKKNHPYLACVLHRVQTLFSIPFLRSSITVFFFSEECCHSLRKKEEMTISPTFRAKFSLSPKYLGRMQTLLKPSLSYYMYLLSWPLISDIFPQLKSGAVQFVQCQEELQLSQALTS